MLLRLLNRSVFMPKCASPLGLTQMRAVSYIDRRQLPQPMPFDGPERDYKNFPRPVRQDWPAPVRFLWIPDDWFQRIYPKLGATGGYSLIAGFWLWIVQKEIFIIHGNFHLNHLQAVTWWIFFATMTSLGSDLHRWQKEYDGKPVWDRLEQAWSDLKSWHRESIEREKFAQFQAEGEKMTFNVKRDNIAMQLETVYRERAMEVYRHVKRRLDYQVEVASILDTVQRRYMTNWVLDKVKQSITPEKEKEALQKCIADLQMLAAKA